VAIDCAAPFHRRLSGFPTRRLASLIGSWPEPALLESGPGFADSGRWSVYAAAPRVVFEAIGDSWTIRTEDGTDRGRGDALAALAQLLDRFGLADPSAPVEPSLPPFTGGLIGYFGYDLAPCLERLPRKAERDSAMPDVRFALYDTVVTVDHLTGGIDVWSRDFLGEGDAERDRRGRRLVKALEKHSALKPVRASRLGPVESHFSHEQYLEAVSRCLEYVAAGDVFQINMSQRFTAWGRPEPLDLYLRLKRRSPAPFAAFLRWGELAVASASPEWFYQTRGDWIVTRPIKGTRPRGASAEEDELLRNELAASPKDRAELTMIVDLERNDLGRVCQYGTVRVAGPLSVESFAQVHHLVATVEGRLRPDHGPTDVVRALFPGGSITGAPKIRAMEIIDELEPVRRGLYTGAIGYFGTGGASAFNIAIRTLLIEHDRVSFQVGGGIVADSTPEGEYRETLHKGRGLRAVVEGEGE
jgi:para-aminobenzoate synthetase component 1